MVRKILRSEAPQNDREGGEAHLRMTERGEKPRRGMTAFLPCHSERSEESSLPSLSFFTPLPVILSAAKNLFSRLKVMVRRILRSEAPQNDRRGSSPPNDREGGEPRRGMTAFLSCHSVPPLVILSAAKNLFSRYKDMVRKILRSEAPQNDREGGSAARKDRERESGAKTAEREENLPASGRKGRTRKCARSAAYGRAR